MRVSAVTVSVVALLLAGCSNTSGDGGTSPPDVTATAGDTTEPAQEPTGPESTQPKQEKPSVRVASLPIGGSSVNDEHPNCFSINLTDTSIPAGTTIELSEATFKPMGVFEVDDHACPGDLPGCPGVHWTADQHDTCYVGVRQSAKSGTATLRVPGRATCTTQADCDTLLGRPGSQIVLTAQTSETPNETPPETPNETPAETPPDTPAETPSS
jgi:hypothetical protein